LEELHKLKHLIDHWIEHNDGHMESYESWAQKAAEMGKPGLEAALNEVLEGTKKVRESVLKGKKEASG